LPTTQTLATLPDNIMTLPSPLTVVNSSRFLQRWLAAKPTHAPALEQLAELSLDQLDFGQLLNAQRQNNVSLPAAMRRLRNLLVAAIVQRDISGKATLDEVLAAISDFAEFAIRSHLEDQFHQLCAKHGTPTGEESGQAQHMMVIGMGKLGGGELNVSSDIDLIFIYPEEGETVTTEADQRSLSNHEFFIRLGKRLIADLAEVTEDGFSFRVDMALRPNGGSGPLAASLSMLENYLMVQGREWERYAWVKARALTGRSEDIEALDAIVRPFVYRRYLDFGSIDALRSMHAQIRADVIRQETRHPERTVNVKLGRGGIREIEFLAQVFQLIRGGRDPELRDRSTRKTLHTLSERKLLPSSTTEQLLDDYAFLRNIEHRVQYLDDAQTHVLPASAEDQLIIANMADFTDVAAMVAELEHRRARVAAQFDIIFVEKNSTQSPKNESELTATSPIFDDADPEMLSNYLTSIGFDEPTLSANNLLASWNSNRIRSLSEQRRTQLHTLLIAALPIIAEQTESHSSTLYRLIDFFETIVRRSAYLSLLTEYPHTLKRLVRMMAASEWAAKYLTRHPVLLDELLDDESLQAEPDWNEFASECRRQVAAFGGDTERQMDVLREQHHAQLFRLLAKDIDGLLNIQRLADYLSALADLVIEIVLETVWKSLPTQHRGAPRFAVIAYGKLGGKELGYASDLDVIFLYEDDDPEAAALYARLAQRFITWMTSHTSAGILFDVDIALRPDGASGLLVSSFTAFEKYQRESAWVWEHQALTRARFCAGDPAIGARFETLRAELLKMTRDKNELTHEVLTMRQRMHDAHPNQSDLFDLKHDSGGMIDIEFIVQYLILRYATQYPELTADIGNIALLKLLGQLQLIDASLAKTAADAYRDFRKLQHQIRLKGADKARIELSPSVETQRNAVRQLWHEAIQQLPK
jgi:[glutamine synthetase] adenylyltransferase / [glutamine synthetase]-adenylyl-L-tyrosine phosphorylase